MAKVYEAIDARLREWIERQPLCFVATAGLSADATVNLSPKSTEGTVVVLDERRVAYLDLTGSGIETVAHLRENGRITVMWCAFEGPPRIVRVHGRGRVVLPDDEGWASLAERFVAHRGARAIVEVTASRISDACGYTVPRMALVEPREALDTWTANRTDDELVAYRELRNTRSIDGLPGLGPT